MLSETAVFLPQLPTFSPLFSSFIPPSLSPLCLPSLCPYLFSCLSSLPPFLHSAYFNISFSTSIPRSLSSLSSLPLYLHSLPLSSLAPSHNSSFLRSIPPFLLFSFLPLTFHFPPPLSPYPCAALLEAPHIPFLELTGVHPSLNVQSGTKHTHVGKVQWSIELKYVHFWNTIDLRKREGWKNGEMEKGIVNDKRA